MSKLKGGATAALTNILKVGDSSIDAFQNSVHMALHQNWYPVHLLIRQKRGLPQTTLTKSAVLSDCALLHITTWLCVCKRQMTDMPASL